MFDKNRLILEKSASPPHSISMATTQSLQFKVLVYPEAGPDSKTAYIAHCLNYDLVAKGENVRESLNSLERIILGQILVSLNDGIVPFSDFDPAPAEFWERYNQDGKAALEAFSVKTSVGIGDLEFADCKHVSGQVTGQAIMKLAA